MKNNRYPFYFIIVGLISLALGILCGLLAGFQYIIPNFIKSIIPFNALRPLHTLFVVSWILLASMGGIYYFLDLNFTKTKSYPKLIRWHFWLFILTGIGIIYAYLVRHFGGKEYLEFPSYFYFPIMIGWILFGINYLSQPLGVLT